MVFFPLFISNHIYWRTILLLRKSISYKFQHQLTMKSVVIALAFFVACTMASNSTNCGSYGDCPSCTLAGCNYCNAYSQTAFCTSAETASAAGCTQQGVDQMDVFVTSVQYCYGPGGCGTAESCSQCSQYVGCGYCWQSNGMNSQGCVPSPQPASCTVWSGSTCVIPCNGRTECGTCLDTSQGGASCDWCSTQDSDPTAGSCIESASTSSSCWSKANQCPIVATPSTAYVVEVAVALVVMLAVIAL